MTLHAVPRTKVLSVQSRTPSSAKNRLDLRFGVSLLTIKNWMMSSWTYRGRPVIGACAWRSVSRLGAGEVTDLAAGTARGPGDHYLAASSLLICGDVDHSEVMREAHMATAGEEVRRMQDGIRDWV